MPGTTKDLVFIGINRGECKLSGWNSQHLGVCEVADKVGLDVEL